MASSSTEEISPLPGSCLVISGNRGLGLEVVRHLKKRDSNVLATTRSPSENLNDVGVSVIEGIDVTESDAGTKLVDAVKENLGEDGKLDYVICVALGDIDAFDDADADVLLRGAASDRVRTKRGGVQSGKGNRSVYGGMGAAWDAETSTPGKNVDGSTGTLHAHTGDLSPFVQAFC